MLKILPLLLMLSGCISFTSDPVTSDHWNACVKLCDAHGVKEACVSSIKGFGCKCGDNKVVFFDLEEDD
jgi:hypothetical protein